MITDIEVQGTSIVVQKFQIDDFPMLPGAYANLFRRDDMVFSTDPEQVGFHDVEPGKDIIRGHFSAVVPFEVEHLVDGVRTKSLLKNIKSQEFILNRNGLYVINPAPLTKVLTLKIGLVVGQGFPAYDIDLRAFQERLSDVAAIRVQNPPKTGIRTASLSGGDLESYEEYNVINPDHEIKSVSGMYPVGDQTLKITVDQKAKIRFSTPRGYVMDFRAVEAVFDRLCESQGD